MANRENPFSFWTMTTKGIYRVIWSLAKKLNPDTARHLLYWRIMDKALPNKPFTDPILEVKTLGKTFPNPIGIAAGFDKEVKYNDELIRNGFGFGELGTFTYAPDYGFQKTRFLSLKKAILIESESFPNKGITSLDKKLIDRRRWPHVVGVNISSTVSLNDRNLKEQNFDIFIEELQQDLQKTIQHVAPYCDFVTLNLSHQHTLISTLLHNPIHLADLLRFVKGRIAKFAPIVTPKLLLKVPCDGQLNVQTLSDVLMAEQIDGLIVAGFTSSKSIKQKLPNPQVAGYVAGRPLKNQSTDLLRRFYVATHGQLTLIGSGGIFSGMDAFEKITAGASLVQIHSALLYEGPEIANKINRELCEILRSRGLNSLQEAVGMEAF